MLLSQGPVLKPDRTVLKAVAVDAAAPALAGVEEMAHIPGRDGGLSGPAVPPVPGEALGELQTLEAVEKRHILAVLTQTRGVIEGRHGAAAILKLHPNTLRSRMKKLGIQRPAHDIS